MDKKELEEFKKWEYERKQEQIDKYGIDLSEIQIKNRKKKKKKVVTFLSRLGEFFRKFVVITFTLAVFITLFLISVWFLDMNERVDINVEKTFQNLYNIEVKILKQDTSGRTNNGKYYLQRKDEPKIKFTAVKNYGSLANDYLDQIIKYYFELWDSNDKKYFTVNENMENGLLRYELYVDNYPNIGVAAEVFVNFAKFCGNDYKAFWDIYIVTDNDRIYPYTGNGTTHEEAIKNVMDTYNSHQEFWNAINNNEPIPTIN